MKHRLRRVAVLLLACLLACALPCAAFADSGSMTLTVQVPEKHTLTVQADHAEVLYNGTAGTSFLVVRQSEPRLLLRPAEGWRVSRVEYNGADVTAQLSGGYLTLPSMTADGTLQVATTAVPQLPTGAAKRYTVTGSVTRGGAPLAGVTLELRSTPKTSVTDAGGSFRFEEVEAGWHTLTALENGVAIGYAEFELNEGLGTNFHQNADGSFVVTVQADSAELQLQLMLVDEKLVLQTVGATAPTPTPSHGGGDEGESGGGTTGSAGVSAAAAGGTAAPGSAAVVRAVPPTGDGSEPLVVLLAAAASALGLLALVIWRRRRGG